MQDSEPNRLIGIQILRGFAAILVVVYHLALHVEQWFGGHSFYKYLLFSNIGVDLFFILSGFIIYHVHRTHFGDWLNIPDFLGRRLARIFPAYWVTLLATVTYNIALDGSSSRPDLGAILSAAFLVYGIHPVIVGVSWTLSFEMLFYLGFAAVLPLRREMALAILVVWGGACLAFAPSTDAMILSLWVSEFCAGVLVAAGLYGRFRISVTGLIAIVVLLVGAGMWVGRPIEHLDSHTRLTMVLMAVALVAAAANCAFQRGRYLDQFLIQLGEASYAIYLIHYGAIQAVYSILRKFGLLFHFDPLILNFCILLPCLIAGGIIFHRYVERPMSERARDWLQLQLRQVRAA